MLNNHHQSSSDAISTTYHLRQQLKKRLKSVIEQPTIRKKELKAFDRLLSRRSFLQGTGKISLIAGLVSSGIVPTRWAYARPGAQDLKIDPAEVGLTEKEMASVQTPSNFLYGADIYSDTVYATAPEITQQANMHGTLEGLQLIPKLQGKLGSTLENTFYDYGAHYGSMEFVQFAQDSNNAWCIEHYYHAELSEYAKNGDITTQGFQRETIANSDFIYGLDNPTVLKTMTHPQSNVMGDNNTVKGCWWLYVQGASTSQSYIIIRTKSYAYSSDNLQDALNGNVNLQDSGWQVVAIKDWFKAVETDGTLPTAFYSLNLYHDKDGVPTLSFLGNGSANGESVAALYTFTVDVDGVL